MKRRGGVALVVAAALLALPASASAATTFGADLTQSVAVLTDPAPCTSAVGQDCSFFTLTKTSGATETGSPIDGVLTSVRVKTANPAMTMAVRVLRAQPSPPLSFLNVGPETLISLPAYTVVAGGHITEVTDLHQPISAGDRLGLGWTQPSGSAVFVNASNGTTANCGMRQGSTGAHPVDTSATYSNTPCQFEMLVQATVEPDADHDRFGDETQDQCPTNAITRGPCPTPTAAAHKKKCKKSKRRSAGALVAKRCKKKHH